MFRAIKNYNGQNANNLVKDYEATTGCCGDGNAACQYDVTIPTANAVNNIIIKDREGNDLELTSGFPVTGAANVVAAIKAAIEAVGYGNDDDAVASVTSETSGSNTIYHITGDLTVVSMKHNTSTTVAATAKCTRINRCTFFYAWGGNASAVDFVINGGTAEDLGPFTLAGSTAAQVQAGIEALADWPSTAIANVVETATAFEITITDNATNSFNIDDNAFVRSDCAPAYEA